MKSRSLVLGTLAAASMLMSNLSFAGIGGADHVHLHEGPVDNPEDLRRAREAAAKHAQEEAQRQAVEQARVRATNQKRLDDLNQEVKTNEDATVKSINEQFDRLRKDWDAKVLDLRKEVIAQDLVQAIREEMEATVDDLVEQKKANNTHPQIHSLNNAPSAPYVQLSSSTEIGQLPGIAQTFIAMNDSQGDVINRYLASVRKNLVLRKNSRIASYLLNQVNQFEVEWIHHSQKTLDVFLSDDQMLRLRAELKVYAQKKVDDEIRL